MKTENAPSHKQVLDRLFEIVESVNAAELLTDDELSKVARTVIEGWKIDESSRDKWTKAAKNSMDLALQVKEAKNYPFQGASNVKWPLITVAALQFNARAYPAVVEGDTIVKSKVVGKDDGIPEIDPATGQPAVNPETGEPIWKVPPGVKAEKGERISEHMSWQLKKEMKEWEEDTDTLLIQLPIVGTAFRKVYWDATLERNVSELVPGIDLIVNQATRSLDDAPRVTHRFYRDPNACEERMRSGVWLEVDLGRPSSADGDEMAPHEFIEQHCWLDLDEDGYREPYIVTVHCETEKVVRIVANFEAEDIKQSEKGDRIIRIAKRDYFVKFGFIRDPKGGFYDIGFGQLLESLGAAIDTTINQMLDAGHLQNAGGGFIGSGVRLKKSQLRFSPGVYHTVDAAGSVLKDAIYNMEHPGPSAVLFSLLGMLIEAGKDITATKDILTGQTSENQTATTTLALIEQGTKVFTAIFKRIYLSLEKEFGLLYKLNARHLPEEAYFNLLDTPKAVARKDYEEGTYDICPVADPKTVTDMQRMARAEAMLNTLQMNPGGAQEILRRYYTAIGASDIDKLLPPQQGPDPMTLAAAEAGIEDKKASAFEKQTKGQKNLADIEGEAIEREVRAVEALEAPEKDALDRGERAEERELKAKSKAA
jgi:chaperonin GroES